MYSFFKDILDSNEAIPEHKLMAGYDFNNEEYVILKDSYVDQVYVDGEQTSEITRDSYGAIWSDKIQAWTTEFDLQDTVCGLKTIYSGREFYIIGTTPTGEAVIEEMYNGDIFGQILEEVHPSEIEFIVNPVESKGKTFDVLRIDSTNRVSFVDVEVEREDQLGNISTGPMSGNIRPREDGYEIPTLRGTNNIRMRGKSATVTITMENGVDSPDIAINKVETKFRMESRIFK